MDLDLIETRLIEDGAIYGWGNDDATLDMLNMATEIRNLRRALDLAGIPAQAKLDPKAPPLKTTVVGAIEIMEMVDGNV